MTLLDANACSFPTLRNKCHRELILSAALLLAGVATFVSPANAQKSGPSQPKLSLNLATSAGIKSERECNSSPSVYDRLVEVTALCRDSAAGSSSCCSDADSAADNPGQHPNNTKDPYPADNEAGSVPKSKPVEKTTSRRSRPDFNRDIYYRHKLEFSLDVGWLPINVPFPFDVFEGDPYDLYPLRYTLVPIIASLRWHLGDIWGPPVLRGNWDVTVSGEITAIPRGAETHYISYDMGLRRNFVPRNWRATPYLDVRAGVGIINAKGPLGVYYAQGQDLTFNLNMGSGVRYDLNPRYAVSAGLNWMHISNANMSAPAYSNYGINVYGPMFGVDITLHPRRHLSE